MTKGVVLSIILSISFSTFNMFAQRVVYDVRLAGKDIGEITVSLDKNGKQETYEVKSDVKFKVLWNKYHRLTNNFVLFENEALKTSYSSISMNNELEDSTSLHLSEGVYNCYRHPSENFQIKNALVHYSTVKLYFEEPIGKSLIYSERFLEYCPIKPIGNGKYRLYLPNGKENSYTYENGELVEVFVDRTWFNIRFCKSP